MKKLLVVLSVLFVFALLAGSAFPVDMYDPETRAAKLAEEKAAVLKASGEFTFGSITSFTDTEGAIGFANMYVDLRMWPDEYNMIFVEINGAKATGFASNVITANAWYIATDVGKILDLPVGLMSYAGKADITSRKYEVSGLAYERPVRPDINPLAWKAMVSTDMFSVQAGIGFGEGLEALNDLGFLVSIPEVGPASIEAYYLVQDNADFEGDFGFNVKATGLLNEMLGVAGGFIYNTPLKAWAYGVGASVKYNMFKFGLSFNGNDTDAFNVLGVDANAALTDVFGIDAALGLGFFDGADTFQGAEFSGYAKVGASKWSVGYQIKDAAVAAGSFNYVPAVANAQGGLFVAVDADF